MSQENMKALFLKNWYLIALLVAVLAGAVYLGVSPGGESTEAPRALNAPESVTTVSGEETPVRSSFFKDETTSKDVALSQIAEYDAKYQAEPTAKDAPLYIRRIANLYYSSMRDWEKAAAKYEELLLNFPDDPKNFEIYPNLAQCYENLNDRSNAISVYRKMMTVFPEGSQYRLLAMQKLNE